MVAWTDGTDEGKRELSCDPRGHEEAKFESDQSQEGSVVSQ